MYSMKYLSFRNFYNITNKSNKKISDIDQVTFPKPGFFKLGSGNKRMQKMLEHY